MSVYQVEQYYIHMNLKNVEITADIKGRICAHLEESNWTNYEFQDNDTTLIIDDIEDESEGESLEAEIIHIIG
jgi:hypothetical protein